MMQVTQMIGMKTQASILSSKSSPINYQLQHQIIISKQVQIMSTEQHPWKQFFTFFAMRKQEPIRIPKEDLQTWDDLLYELSDATNFQQDYVEVVINNQRVYYDPKTRLIDIGIKKEDTCIVLKKPHFKNPKERQNYELEVQKKKEECRRALVDKLEDDESIRLVSFIESNDEYQSLFNELACEFQRMEVMVAIEESQGERAKARAMLEGGEARNIVGKRQAEVEKQELREFLATPELRQLKAFIKEKGTDEKGYIGIIQKLHAKYPRFRKLEPKHQMLVKKDMMNLPYLDSDQDSEDEENPYLKRMFELVASLQKQKQPKTIAQASRNEFVNSQKAKGRGQKQVRLALAQAANNVEKAEELVGLGVVERVDAMVNFVKKTARINLVLQFFARPEFQRIRTDLRGQREKADRFVEWIVSKHEENRLLSNLIARYKDYAVTYLSEEFAVEKPEKLEAGDLKLVDPLSPEKEKQLREEVSRTCNEELVAALRRSKVEERLAAKAVRAAMNKEQYLGIYLLLGGVNQQFDFCPADTRSEQVYLHKRLKKEKELLGKLGEKKEELLFLGKLSVIRPRLFEMIVKNKAFVDQIVRKSDSH